MLAYLDPVPQTLSECRPSWRAHFEEHRKSLVRAVFAAFTFVNSIRIFADILQILKAVRDENGATAVSWRTWGLFLLSHLASIVYSLVCLGDLVMAVIFFRHRACLFRYRCRHIVFQAPLSEAPAFQSRRSRGTDRGSTRPPLRCFAWP